MKAVTDRNQKCAGPKEQTWEPEDKSTIQHFFGSRVSDAA